jgi:hypothetical protein
VREFFLFVIEPAYRLHVELFAGIFIVSPFAVLSLVAIRCRAGLGALDAGHWRRLVMLFAFVFAAPAAGRLAAALTLSGTGVTVTRAALYHRILPDFGYGLLTLWPPCLLAVIVVWLGARRRKAVGAAQLGGSIATAAVLLFGYMRLYWPVLTRSSGTVSAEDVFITCQAAIPATLVGAALGFGMFTFFGKRRAETPDPPEQESDCAPPAGSLMRDVLRNALFIVPIAWAVLFGTFMVPETFLEWERTEGAAADFKLALLAQDPAVPASFVRVTYPDGIGRRASKEEPFTPDRLARYQEAYDRLKERRDLSAYLPVRRSLSH